MYKSPIDIFTQTANIVKKMHEKQDEYVYQCVLKTGVNVDKEELIKALKYDREQYSKGYTDGINEFAERLRALMTRKDFYPVFFKNILNEVKAEMGVRDNA